MITLRPYQETGIEEVRQLIREGKRRIIYVLPTGGGKSVFVSAIAKGVREKQKRGMMMAHRQELIDQLGNALSDFNVYHAVLSAEHRRDYQHRAMKHDMLLGSVQTIARRTHKINAPDFIFVDECHHAIRGGLYARIIEAYPNAIVLGLTASPARTDGRGLGEMFDGMVVGPSVEELTAMGYLVPAEVWGTPIIPDLSGVKTRAGDYAADQLADAMDKPRLTGDAVSHYRKIADGKAAVAFCCSVKHAHSVAAQFCEAGYRFVAVDGEMDKRERRQAIDDLRTGKIHGITSAEVISEGVDVPRIEAVILLRPTQSLIVAIQQIGRGLRPYPGKDKCIVLDHAGVVARHGLPDEPREWSLEGVQGRKKGDKPPAVRTCPECFAAYRPQPQCPQCGFVHKVEGRKVEQVEGELVKIDPKSLSSEEVMARPSNEKELAYLTQMARRRGYKNPEGWAYIVVRAREAKRRAREMNRKVANG